jgi:hypothetical protein
MPILKLFQRIIVVGTLRYSFYKASIIFDPKTRQVHSKKENYKPISMISIDAKNVNKIQKIKPSSTQRSLYTVIIKWALSQECLDVATFSN